MASKRHVAQRFQLLGESLSLDTAALAKYDNIIDLSIGDMDLATDEVIIDQAFADAKQGYTRYGNPKGDPELIEAIQQMWQEDYQQTIGPEEVLVSTSSCLGMSVALMSIIDPGDEVLVFAPYFSPYKHQIELAGGVCVIVPLSAEDGYAFHPEQIEEYINENTKAMILNNPCNPTGQYYDKDSLEIIARLAKDHDLFVLSDEIYTNYVFDEAFTPLRTLDGMEDYTITLNSFSKNFMMTGWRVGYVIAPPEVIQVMKHINDSLIYTTPALSQRAALEAIQHRHELLPKYKAIYEERLRFVVEKLKEIPYLEFVEPKGTFYVFPRLKSRDLTTKEFVNLLLEECQVLVTPGYLFGEAGEGHVRIACTKPIEELDEALERMKQLEL